MEFKNLFIGCFSIFLNVDLSLFFIVIDGVMYNIKFIKFVLSMVLIVIVVKIDLLVFGVVK